MTPQRKPPTRHRSSIGLVTVGVLLLALSWALALTEIARHRSESVRDAEKVVALKAQIYAEATRPVLRHIDDLLLDLRDDWRGDRQQMAVAVGDRQSLSRDLPVEIAVIDASGFLAYADRYDTTEHIDLSDREQFRVHRDGGGGDALFISRPIKRRASGQWSVQFTRPILRAGTFDGVIVASVRPESLTALHAKLALADDGASSIVRTTGEVIACRPRMEALVGNPVSGPFSGSTAPDAGYFHDQAQFDGIERIAGYFKIPEYGWTFIAAVSHRSVLEAHADYRRTVLGYAAAASIVIVLVLLAMFRARTVPSRIAALEAECAAPGGALFDALPVGITLTDRDGRIVYGNAHAQQLLGPLIAPPATDPGTGVAWSAIRPDGSPMPPDELAGARALREQMPVDGVEMGVVRPDGIRWLLVSAAPSSDPRYGVAVSYVDVTAGRGARPVFAEQRRLTKQILDALGDLVWLKNAEGVYLACNARFERFFGATEADIVGKTDYDFVDADLADFFRAHDRAAMEKNGPSVNHEWISFADDGHRELLETTKTPMFDERGRLIGILGVGHDITVARRLQDALEASHNDLLMAQAVARVGSWTIDLNTDAITWSPMTYRLFGVDQGQPVDLSRFMDLVHPDDIAMVRGKWHEALSTGRLDVEHRVEVAGETCWVRERADFIRNDEGVANSAFGTVLDITERRRLEDELREQQQRLANIIEGTNVGTWEWNVKTGEVVFNERWAAMIGYTLAELEPIDSETWFRMLHPDDRVPTEALLQGHFSGSTETFEAEFRMRHKLGFWVWILALGRVNRRAPDGQPLWMSGTQLDMTERKVTEEALSALAGAMTLLAGGALYEAISRHLAEVLNLDYVFAGRLDAAGTRVQVVSGWDRGSPMTPFSYDLADTPCANVMKRRHALYPCGVQAMFPDDELLVQMEIESYIGSTLFDKTGQPMGILVGLSSNPIHRPDLADRLLGVFVDSVSAEMMRIQAEDAILAARNRLDAILQTTQDAVWLSGRDGRIVDVNPAACRLLGYSRAEMLARAVQDIDASREARRIEVANDRIVRDGGARFETRHRTKDGRLVDVDVAISDLPGEALQVAFIRDISERKQAESNLRQAASVFEFSHEGIMITDPEGTIIDVNDAFCRITGYGREEVAGRNPSFLKSSRHDEAFYAAMWRGLKRQGYWSCEVWNRRRNGEIFAQMQTISAVKDRSGAVLRYVCLFSDITQQKEHQHQLERIAHYDALTGLPNRVLLADRLRQAMARVQRDDKILAVVFLDLDGFKAVNDKHSHEIGDKLLTQLSARMMDALREVDTLSRLGGDEFVVVLVDLQSHDASVPVIDRLLAAVSEPTFVDGLELRVSASIGISFYPQASEVDGDQLLRQADQAMYQAKQAGKNRFQVFDVEHDRSVRGYNETLGRIGQALQQREFVLLYQPKVNMRSGEVVGVEALIRWQHPERGSLPPSAFLPVIKGNPLINEIGDWVLETALAQIATWRRAGLSLPVSVNVDALQFDQSDFMDKLQALLAGLPGFRPGDLVLEVLETSALEDVDQISEIILACQAQGVHFALDDFGTGYSSLTYLKRLPAQLLKVDQSFVRGMLDSPEDLAILGGVLGLAEAFRRRVIAEGVETQQHGEMLIQMGCEFGQGYAIARPMAADAVPDWVATWKPAPGWTRLTRVDRDDLPVLFAMVEHRAWVADIRRYVDDESAAPPPIDCNQCQFGRWLDEIGADRGAGEPVLRRVTRLHEAIHQHAAELIDLKGRGLPNLAQSQVADLEAMRDELLEALHRLIS